MSGGASDIPMEGTISYEDALERELEYKKRFELSRLQAPACNKFLPPPSHKLPTEQNLTGIKRKLVSGSLSEAVPPSTNDPKLPPKQFQGQGHQAHPHLQFQQPSLYQLQDHKPSVKQTYSQQPSAQIQPFRRPLPLSLPPNQQPSCHNSQGRHPPSWCNLCKLNCENVNNLRFHCQGKKHKAKMQKVHGGKKTIVNEAEVVWCKECNVPCMNENSLAEHCAGKKHAAIVHALKGKNVATSARVSYGY